MSIYGVRRRFVDLLVRGRGVVKEPAYKDLIDYARDRMLTSGEVRALLHPAEYLERNEVLRDHGLSLEDVRFEAGAWKLAESLAREFNFGAFLENLPNARPGAAPPTPAEPPTPVSSSTFTEALARGKSLGAPTGWQVTTTGATIRFVSKAGNAVHPGVSFHAPEWKDPAPKDLVAERQAALSAVSSLSELISFVRKTVDENKAWFNADEVKGKNERFGVQDLRRHAFFTALGNALSDVKLSAAERPRAPAVLASEKERLLCNRDYDMEVGSHTNYWPYWDNYRPCLEKMLAQTASGTDAFFAIKNRLEDVFNHKTVFGFQREIDEQDLEQSVGGAYVSRRPYSLDDGHRVSLAEGSWPTAPIYELLTVKNDVPSALSQYAGKRVYRDTDSAKTIRIDPGGEPLPAEAVRFVVSSKVEAGDLGLRGLKTNEKARDRLAGDWNGDGGIEITPIEIGWWGHCHNEAPLNAMGVDPKRGVELYRADPRVPAASRLQSYSAEDVWDVCGALTADHEAGYANAGEFGLRDTQVEVTKFVGSRNDGGHWLLVEPGRQGARRVRIDAEITDLWHKSDPTKKYDNPAERFRRDQPDGDGTFSANPEWVAADADDEDEITVDCLGRRLNFTATYVTFDGQGNRVEKKDSVSLDPTRDGLIKLADEIVDTYGQAGGKLAEHWYDAKKREYVQVIVEVKQEGGFKRKEIQRTQPAPVTRVLARQETEYDSVIDIHEFVTKNMGLPFVFDTSSGMAVWNYPVNKVRLDREKEVDEVEGGKAYTFTTYRMSFTTMGGPASTPRYIIKRDEKGNAVRALALDPMPDFAFRNELWICAPLCTDVRGQTAYNVSALQSGYLTDKARDRLVTDLWKREAALLYASLAAPTTGDTVYVIETEDGAVHAFPDKSSFDAAVKAHKSAAP